MENILFGRPLLTSDINQFRECSVFCTFHLISRAPKTNDCEYKIWATIKFGNCIIQTNESLELSNRVMSQKYVRLRSSCYSLVIYVCIDFMFFERLECVSALLCSHFARTSVISVISCCAQPDNVRCKSFSVLHKFKCFNPCGIGLVNIFICWHLLCCKTAIFIVKLWTRKSRWIVNVSLTYFCIRKLHNNMTIVGRNTVHPAISIHRAVVLVSFLLFCYVWAVSRDIDDKCKCKFIIFEKSSESSI